MSASGRPAWDPLGPLPEPGETWVLEASAGTGKTFQIASLVVRLVAEAGVELKRVLAITFTHAATAELRDRIRKRLAQARDALSSPPDAPEDDPLLQALRAAKDDTQRLRLEAALRSFDEAGISTIHGFSQRMLQEFAFDSGQESELTLLPDASTVRAQLVDDTLARLWAGASPEVLVWLDEAHVDREHVRRIVGEMAAVVEPRVEPAGPASTDEARMLVEAENAVAAWREKTEVFAALFEHTTSPGVVGGEALLEAISLSASLKKAKSFDGRRLQARYVVSWLEKVAALARARATPATALADEGLVALADRVLGAWQHTPADIEVRPFWPLVAACRAHRDAARAAWATFQPLAAIARGARARFEAELVRTRSLTFDGMVSRLAERIETDGGAASPLAARLRGRYDVVLVDEFQDTDLAQWTVVEAAFHGHARLVLIGDPKQAIYAFRGADLNVYLRARGVGHAVFEMRENWRSDPRTVEAQNLLWRAGSGPFLHPEVDYVEVEARRAERLLPARAGLEVRWVDSGAETPGAAFGGALMNKADATRIVSERAAREAHRFVATPHFLVDDGGAQRRLTAGDVAVLVHDHRQAAAMRAALNAVGLPSVAASRDSVFASPVAAWLALWLLAVAEAGGADPATRTCALTPLFGWSVDRLARAVDAEQRRLADEPLSAEDEHDLSSWTALRDDLVRAHERWRPDGFVLCLERALAQGGALERILADTDGERLATDLRHLVELLNAEDRVRRRGPGPLALWLRAQAEAAEGGDALVQRLESDALAVRIETVHASKGLEYPIVLLPFAWADREAKAGEPPILVRRAPEDDEAPRPALVFAPDDALATARTEVVAEDRREALRKAYVALTRAKHLTVLWMGPLGRANAHLNGSAIARLLMREPGVLAPWAGDVDCEADAARVRARLDALVHAPEGDPSGVPAIRWTREVPDAEVDAHAVPATTSPTPAPQVATWPRGRALVSDFVVTSFSRLEGVSAAPDTDEKRDALEAEGGTDADPTAVDTARGGVPPLDPRFDGAPMHPLPGGGTDFGSYVHKVFETLDFRARGGRDGASLETLLATTAPAFGLPPVGEVVTGLRPHVARVLDTPLDASDPATRGAAPEGFTLGALETRDRLDELAFDLRLGGGPRHPRGTPTPTTATGFTDAILRRRGDPAFYGRRWLEALAANDAAAGLLGRVTGFLSGSIDLVFRVGDRYWLADYKTNRIRDSRPANYDTPWMAWEMARMGYPLQALLYTVALDRHLAARVPDYRYDTHFGGVLYLFLRGMGGAPTPRDPRTGTALGVLADRWPEPVVRGVEAALGLVPVEAP